MTDEPWPTSDVIVEALTRVLGRERAQLVVAEAVSRCGVAGDTLGPEDLDFVWRMLEAAPGLEGLAARFAHARFHLARARQSSIPPPPPAYEDAPRPVLVAEIVALLTPSLGAEKAAECVQDGMRELLMRGVALPNDRALALLEHLASQSGPVGVTARFVKARLTLR